MDQDEDMRMVQWNGEWNVWRRRAATIGRSRNQVERMMTSKEKLFVDLEKNQQLDEN
jgi:hypothetical protein